MPYQRKPFQVPPRYEIDALLSRDLKTPHVAFEVMQELWCAIEGGLPKDYFRPDSSLLEPEIVVSDIGRWSTMMGNGFVVALETSGGILCFSRALHSVRIVGHRKAIAILEQVRELLQQSGFEAFTDFPDDPIYGWREEWDDQSGALDANGSEQLAKATGEHGVDLDRQWWAIERSYFESRTAVDVNDPPLEYAVCNYLVANRALLGSRKVVT